MGLLAYFLAFSTRNKKYYPKKYNFDKYGRAVGRVWGGGDGATGVAVQMRYIGGLGGHNQCGISLVELVPASTREVIFLALNELVFLEQLLSKNFNKVNIVNNTQR